MFEEKKKKLFDVPEEKASMDKKTVMDKNPFIRAAVETNTILSGNGAVKLQSTGSDFIDQFASASKYREPRSYGKISKDMSVLWAQDPLLAVKFIVYLRLITRRCVFPDSYCTKTLQKGQGLKHEGIMRMIWLFVNHPETFIRNIPIFIAVGSWKDFITMMQYDAMYNDKHSFDWNIIAEVIKEGLSNPLTCNLVKKYLPSIRTKKKCTTIESQADNVVAKYLCSYLFGKKYEDDPGKMYAKYRRLKASGTAHLWQQAISRRRMNEIDFDTIAGRALQKLVNSKFLENWGLEEKYVEWLKGKPTIKFTGYVYELFGKLKGGSVKKYQIDTINEQFYRLVDQAKTEGVSSFICVLDTSGSMFSNVPGLKVSAYEVAKSMTLFFSELLKGEFYDCYFEFSEKATFRKFKGTTPVEKYLNANSSVIGNTNFLSVAYKFVEILNKGVSERDFPSGMLLLSDGEFDKVGELGLSLNVKEFRKILLRGGFSKEFVDNFKIVFWDIPNTHYSRHPVPKFEALADTPNTFHIGGLDGSVVSFLMGKEGEESIPSNSEELFFAAMDQEVLSYVKV